jgi:hypothetical protein
VEVPEDWRSGEGLLFEINMANQQSGMCVVKVPLLPFQKALDNMVVGFSDMVDCFELSLRDDFSMSRQTIPCRGRGCTHPETFELRNYVAHNRFLVEPVCTICQKPTPAGSLQQDELVLRLLSAISSESVKIRPQDKTYEITPEHGEANTPTAQAVIEIGSDSDAYDSDCCIVATIVACSDATISAASSAASTATSTATSTAATTFRQLCSLPVVQIPEAVVDFNSAEKETEKEHLNAAANAPPALLTCSSVMDSMDQDKLRNSLIGIG